MATVLENYYALRGELEQRMAQAPINAVDLWYYGEIVYRVGVLETCQMYLRSAPVSMNTPELLGHYQMMDAMCGVLRWNVAMGRTAVRIHRKSGKPLRVTWDV